jgi:hypothetical protein
MSAAKSIVLSLLVASFAPAAQSETSSNVQESLAASKHATGYVAVALQRELAVGAGPATFSDQLAAESRPVIPSSNKWLIFLLFGALAGYQLRRNDRALNHRLTNQ